jgi:transposase-like protein
MSASELIREALKKNPNPTTEEIRQIAEEVKKKTGKGTPSLVYKWLRKMPESERRVVSAGEPVITTEEEPEVIMEEEETEEPPSFEEEEAGAAEERPAEVPAAEGLLEEEERKFNDIIKRSVLRLFNIGITEGLGLGKDLGINDQEAEDTQFLAMAVMKKYFKVEIRENLLEIAAGVHFGSLGVKVLVAWIKKRRAEAKKKEEEEKERQKTQEPPITPPAEPPPAPPPQDPTKAEKTFKDQWTR